jgi:hypothetical protein
MAQQANLQIPSTEIIESSIEDNLEYGKFYFAGLRKGQGITVANALRRVLLYDIQGIGITSLQFSKNSKESPLAEPIFYNEFSSIPRFRESILEIGINISSIVCRLSPINSLIAFEKGPCPPAPRRGGDPLQGGTMGAPPTPGGTRGAPHCPPIGGPGGLNDLEGNQEKIPFSSESTLETESPIKTPIPFFLSSTQPGGLPLEKRFFCLQKMFDYLKVTDAEFFKLKESQIFTLRAKHIFDPKFCTVSSFKDESFLNGPLGSSETLVKKNGVRTKDSLELASLDKVIDPQFNDPILETTSINNQKVVAHEQSQKFCITLKNPDYEIASIFVSYDSKTGFEYPDLNIEYTIGTLNHIQFRNQQMGENPGGIQIGGSSSNLLLSFISTTENSSDRVSGQNYTNFVANKNWFTCTNETNFFPVKKVNYTVQETNQEEEVFLEIWTNGSLNPKEVLSQALALLINLFENLSI